MPLKLFLEYVESNHLPNAESANYKVNKPDTTHVLIRYPQEEPVLTTIGEDQI